MFIKIHCTMNWSSVSYKVAKTIKGRVGLFFYWDAFDIKMMVWEKTVNANFNGVWWSCKHLALGLLCPATNSSKGYKGWDNAPRCKHLTMGLPCLGCWGQTCASCYRPRQAGLQTSTSGVYRPASLGSNSLLMYQCPDPVLMDPASGSNFLWSSV